MDDMAVPQHHRTGAHRARRHPLLTSLLSIGAVALASALLLSVLLYFDVLGVGDDLLTAGGSGSAAPSGAPPVVDDTAPAEPAPGTAPSDVPSGAAPSGTAPSGAPPSVAPSPEPVPSADRSLTLDVLNSTSTSGLAARAADALQEQGWTIGEVTNFDGDEIDTTVLFAAEEQRLTAETVAAELGIGTVTLDEDVDVLTVVLGPDYDS